MFLVHWLVVMALPLDAAPPRPAGKDAKSATREAAVGPETATPAPVAAPAPEVRVNRTAPATQPVPLTPVFSAVPTDEEFLRARVFAEPFVPIGGVTTPEENAAFAAALVEYVRNGNNEDVTVLGRFLAAFPNTAWRASLLTNLGAHYQRTGYFTRAAMVLAEAWTLARTAADAKGRAIAGRALAELLDLHMRFGHVERLEEALAEVGGLDLHGSAAEKTAEARRAVYVLRNEHRWAIPSGSMSVDRLAGYGMQGHFQHPEIAKFHATPEGASLAEVRDLAERVGLKLQMAYRPPGAPVQFVTGSIVHLEQGHFAALVRQDGNHYLLADPMLGAEEFWISRAALQEEVSGYALIPAGALPEGWSTVAASEVAGIRGKCVVATWGGYCRDCDGNVTCNGPICTAMAGYTFVDFMASLVIKDTPVGYAPPVGRRVDFTLRYHQRESYQPQLFTFANVGRRWNFFWLSYLEDDPSNPNAAVSLYPPGGSKEIYTGFNGSTYTIERHSRLELKRVSTSPIRYELAFPDGSLQVFTQADGGVSPRRVFMTEWRDAQGNALQMGYDQQLRLVSITDAIGQVTTLSYELIADPLKITTVTDPFGRFARLDYDASGALVQITDVIGITSEFQYGGQDFIRALTTAYGTTTFAYGNANTHTHYWDWWLEATDPLGGRERVEWVWNSSVIPASEPAANVPVGFINNAQLNLHNTFYWDKRAMMLYPGDYTKARIKHWLYSPTTVMIIDPALHSEKMPLENRVWYGQAGETIAGGSGPQGRPAKVGRVLDDGTSQIYRYEYNPLGKVTRFTDPLGRETIYEYDGNGIDLLRIKQTNPASAGGYDLLQTRTYNSLHEPLTVTDAAGQTTTSTYNAAGQILTRVTPLRSCAGCAGENRTTTWSYDTNGYLQSTTRPATGATSSSTYDGYGRVRTVTDEDSYVLTYDYDALDRPTRTTYPDGTYEETVYSRLDAEKTRDRLGRWTHSIHDSLRRVVSTRDPLGRTLTLQWCTCGSLDKLIDPNGNATSWDRDLQGRMTKETRVDGSFWEYTYETTTSRLKKQKDAKGQETQYTYFLDDQLQQVSYPTAQIATPSVSYTYESAYPRLATTVDGLGTTTYSYHPVTATPPLGATQLASVDGPFANDAVTYGYDELGSLVSRTLNSVTTTSSYDTLGRLTSLGDSIGNFTSAYVGTTSRLSSVTYPNGQTTTYAYFPNSGDKQLQEIHHRVSAGGATLSKLTYGYDAVGNITLWTQQYGAAAANAYDLKYDGADQISAATYRTTDPTPVTLKRYGYAYDPAGNRTAEQIDDAPMSSSFDNRNRLTSQQPGGTLVFKGSLNEPATVAVAAKPATVGSDNKFQGSAQVGSGTSNVVVTATDPSGNLRTNTYQVNVSGSSRTFTYDANGSLTAEGTKTYEWDGANRLVRVLDNAAEIARFVYDGQGRRAQKIAGGVTRTYVYDGEDILEDRPSSGATVRYVQGPGIDQPLASVASGIVSYFLADHLRSVLQTTNSSSTVTLTRQYDVWGNLLQGSSTGGYAFTGREWDPETGLYYYRARYYDPKLGGFTSEDPVDFRDGLSRYTYVMGRPSILGDPSGLIPCTPNCPEDVKQGARDACNFAKTIPNARIRRCVKDKCKDPSVSISCETPANGEPCNIGSGPAYTWRPPAITICLNNPPNPKQTCYKRIIIHEMWDHLCRSGGPAWPKTPAGQKAHDKARDYTAKNVRCP